MHRILITLLAASLIVTGCSDAPPTVTGPGAEVRDLTGALTRAVWVQSDGTDPRASGDQLILMGLDTHDGGVSA